MSESQKPWPSSGAEQKSCKTCFFGTIKDFKQAPCWNCKWNNKNGLEGAYDPDHWVTNSEEFWKDKEEPKKMTESYKKDAARNTTWFHEAGKEPFEVPSGGYYSGEATVWPFPPDVSKENPLDVQVGGSHYKNLGIQPIEYCHENKLGPCESNIVKYITRWKDKGGKADLEKVKHYVDLLIQLEGL